MAAQLRRERLRAEMIGEIIAAARLLLEKDGPSAISMRVVAHQLGVSATALYRYFPSRDALMSAVNQSVISELSAAVESARDKSARDGSAPDGSARDPSGETALAFRAWALEHPASFRFTLGLDGHPGLIGHLLRPPAPPSPPRPPRPPAAMLGWATLCGLVLLELSCDPEDRPEDIRHLYQAAAANLG
jgi:AcrR family transcriptional regulator